MLYETNISKVINDLKGKLSKASDMSQLQRTIATNLKASNLRRIHNDGMAVSGESIGSYSTRATYINPKTSPRKFAGEGKTGKTKFKSTGSLHKTKFFKGGYKEFRSFVGREASKVNLQLSGTLLKAWQAEQQGKDWVIGFNSSYGKKVAEGNEERFGKQIWGVSKQDQEMITTVTQEFINRSLNART